MMKNNTNHLLMLSLATFGLLELTNTNSATAAIVAIKTTFCNPFFDGSRQVKKSWIEIDTELDDAFISTNCNVIEVEDEFVLSEIRTNINSSPFGFASKDEKKNGSDKQRNFLDDFVFWELDDDNISQNASFLASSNIEDYKLSLLTEINLRLDRFSNWNSDENFQSNASGRSAQTALDEDIVVKSSIGSTVWGNDGLLSDNNTELEVSGGGFINGNPFSLANEVREYLFKNDRSIDRVDDIVFDEDNGELEIDIDNDGINEVDFKTDNLPKNSTPNPIFDPLGVEDSNDWKNLLEQMNDDLLNDLNLNDFSSEINYSGLYMIGSLDSYSYVIGGSILERNTYDGKVVSGVNLTAVFSDSVVSDQLLEGNFSNYVSGDSNNYDDFYPSTTSVPMEVVKPVPEPTTMGGLILTGLIGIFTKYKKRQKTEKLS